MMTLITFIWLAVSIILPLAVAISLVKNSAKLGAALFTFGVLAIGVMVATILGSVGILAIVAWFENAPFNFNEALVWSFEFTIRPLWTVANLFSYSFIYLMGWGNIMKTNTVWAWVEPIYAIEMLKLGAMTLSFVWAWSKVTKSKLDDKVLRWLIIAFFAFAVGPSVMVNSEPTSEMEELALSQGEIMSEPSLIYEWAGFDCNEEPRPTAYGSIGEEVSTMTKVFRNWRNGKVPGYITKFLVVAFLFGLLVRALNLCGFSLFAFILGRDMDKVKERTEEFSGQMSEQDQLPQGMMVPGVVEDTAETGKGKRRFFNLKKKNNG